MEWKRIKNDRFLYVIDFWQQNDILNYRSFIFNSKKQKIGYSCELEKFTIIKRSNYRMKSVSTFEQKNQESSYHFLHMK